MLLFKILSSAFLATASVTCQNLRCNLYSLGNGNCELNCNNPYCNFEANLSISFDSNPAKAFEYSDCYKSCLATGCNINNLGNLKCDSDCNTVYCAWDLSDCGVCASGCTNQMLENRVCDKECNVFRCNYDNEYCKIMCGSSCTKVLLEDPICQPECGNESCLKLFPENPCFKQCVKGCYAYLQGNGLCDYICNNPGCLFDLSDCECAPGCSYVNFAEDYCSENDPCDNINCEYKHGICGHCNSQCFDSMLGDKICHQECNNEACGFDLGDCGCAPGCSLIFYEGKWIGLEENKGNMKCLVPSCFYNLFQDDLFMVKWIILTQLYLDDLRITQPRDLSESCTEQNLRLLDEGLEECNIDHGCLNENGLWCLGIFEISSTCLRRGSLNCLVCSGVMAMGKCEYLLKSCPNGMIEYLSMSQLFHDNKVTWCLLDPMLYKPSNEQIFYVKSSNPPKAEGAGSELFPFKSLYYAFSMIYGIYSRIILSSGSHIFVKNIHHYLPLRNSVLEPLKYEYGIPIQQLIIEGETSKIPCIVYWKGSVSITSLAKKVLIKNIYFRGDMIIRDDCDGSTDLCFYCPFYDPQKNYNDLNAYVGNEEKTFYQDNNCSLFKNDELFKFQGKVTIENVTFSNFRQQFKRLIKVQGSLNLTKVNFLKIQPDILGLVVEVSCDRCKDENFLMDSCLIEDLNYGYEERKGIESGSFLKVSGIHSAAFFSSTFRYNFLFSDDNAESSAHFFKLERLLGRIIFDGCLFSVNFINHIILVDASFVKYDLFDADMYDQSKAYSQIHFTMRNVEFKDTFLTGYVLNYEMKNYEHNIDVRNVTFYNFRSVYNQVFKIMYTGDDIDYKVVTIEENSKKVWKPLPKIIFYNLTIQDGILNNIFIDVNKVGLINISKIFVDSIIGFTGENPNSKIKRLFQSAKKYLRTSNWSSYSSTWKGYCGQTIRALKNFNISIQNILIQNWESGYISNINPGIYIEDTADLILIDNITGINLISTSDYGQLLTIFTNDKSVKVSNITLKESRSYQNYLLLLNNLNDLNVSNIVFEKSSSAHSALLEARLINYFTASNLSILESYCYGVTSCVYIKSGNTRSPSVKIKELYFYKSKGFYVPLFQIFNEDYIFTSCNLKSIKFNACDTTLAPIFRISLLLIVFDKNDGLNEMEIIKSSATEASLIDLNHNALLRIRNLFISQSSATITGIYVGNKNVMIEMSNSSIINSVFQVSVISLKNNPDKAIFNFNNFTVSNVTFATSPPPIFDIIKTSINGTSITVSKAGRFFIADDNCKISIYDATFYSMESTFVTLARKSNFTCFFCKISNNKGKFIKCSEKSSFSLQSSLIYNNYFISLEQNFIEIESMNVYDESFIKNTSMSNNIILGKLISIISGTLIIEKSTFMNNSLQDESNLIVSIQSNLKIISSNFNNLSSIYSAPYLKALTDSNIEIANCSFIYGISASSGGSIYISSSSLSLNFSEFLLNQVDISGGSLYSHNSTISINTCKFIKSSAKNSGGSIYAIYSIVSINSSEFKQSSALISGGSIYAYNSILSISSSQLIENSAENSGGSIYAYNSFLSIDSTSFKNISSKDSAGSIFAYNSTLSIDSTKFENSSGEDSGGCISAQNSNISMISCEFIQSSAKISGGSIYSIHSNVTVKYCKFIQSIAEILGGGIFGVSSIVLIAETNYLMNSASNATNLYFKYCEVVIEAVNLSSYYPSQINKMLYSAFFINSSVEILASFFTQSTSGVSTLLFTECSSISIHSSFFSDSIFGIFSLYFIDCLSVDLYNSVLSNLHSLQYGSFTFIGLAVYGKVTLKNASFIYNEGENLGGAVYVRNGFLKIESCLFANNSAVSGGAIYFEAPDCIACDFYIKNKSKLIQNQARLDGGGIKWIDSKPVIEKSVIFKNNIAQYGVDLSSVPAFMNILDKSLNESKEFDIELRNISPGQVFSGSILIEIIDTYGQKLIIDNSSNLILESLSSSFSLTGVTSFKSVSGLFNLTGFYPWGTPNSEQGFKATCDSIQTTNPLNDDTKYKQSLFVKIYLRGCVNGEQINLDSCKICEENKYLIKPETKCKQCPVGGICPGGDKIYVKPGYYRTHYLSEIIYTCELISACLGNKNDYRTICDTGYTGIKCRVCDQGFTKSLGYRCSKCPDHQTNILILLFFIIYGLLICGMLVKITIKSAFFPKSKHSIYVKIFTNYIHFMFMISRFDFKWPEYAIKFLQFHKSASIITESVISIDCFISNQGSQNIYYTKLMFVALLPILIIGSSCLIWLTISYFTETYNYMKREIYLTIIVVYFLAFPTMVNSTFSSFDCTEFDKIGEYLSVDYSIKCSTSTHSKYLKTVSLPCIILWIFAFPLFILILMIKRRKRLTQDNNKVIFGLLFNGYNSSIFYWEFIMMYRKVLIISIIVFFKNITINFQANTLLGLLLIFYVIQYKISPYDSKELNKMEKDVLMACIITIFCGLYFITDDMNDEFYLLFFSIMLLASFNFLFFWIYWITKTYFEFLFKIIPFLSSFKQGDAFDEEFFTESVYVQGFIPGKKRRKRIYTFINKVESENKDFDFKNMNDLYEKTFMNEYKDISKEFYE